MKTIDDISKIIRNNNQTLIKKIWVWHSEDDEVLCPDCAFLNGYVFEKEADIPSIPVHPNCRCSIEEIWLDNNGNRLLNKIYKGPIFANPVDTKAGQYAIFDGKSFTIYQDGKPIISWGAVSGRDGFQSPEYQNLKSTGPIPEGSYIARQKELQNRDDYGPIKRYTSWPGGEQGWGKNRVWLEPSKDTNTYGRSKFSIHGGTEPGSAGCIDLTSSMDAFTKWFEKNGHDLIVNVKY